MFKPARCCDCKYWCEDHKVKVKNNKRMGECKKALPTLGSNGYGYWPLTRCDDFCYGGSHKEVSLLNEAGSVEDPGGREDK